MINMQTVQQLLIAILPGLLIGVLIAFISHRLSITRYYSEKWWERKADTYSKILESLYHLITNTEEQMRDPSTINNEIEKAAKELESRSKTASEEINRITSIGAFVISEAASRRLVKLKKELEDAAKREGWYEFLQAECFVLEAALKDMRKLAKDDLRVK